MKLRISTRELIYRIKDWQTKELDNPKRDPWKDESGDFVEAYEFFIRLYFNFPPKNKEYD
jgi:Ni/Co efflux regulator RcnB